MGENPFRLGNEESSSVWVSSLDDLENSNNLRLRKREERQLCVNGINTMIELAVMNPRPVSTMLQYIALVSRSRLAQSAYTSYFLLGRSSMEEAV